MDYHAIQNELETVAAEYAAVFRLENIGDGFHTSTSYLVPAVREGTDVFLKVIRPDKNEKYAADICRHFDGHGIVRILEEQETIQGIHVHLYERLISDGVSLTQKARLGSDGDEQATRIICKVVRDFISVPIADFQVQEAQTLDWRVRHVRALIQERTASDELRKLFERVLQEHDMFAQRFACQFVLGHGDAHHFNILHDGQRNRWVAIDPQGVLAPLPFHLACLGINPYEGLEGEVAIPLQYGRMERLADVLAEEFHGFGVTSRDFVEAIWLNALYIAAMRYRQPLYPGEVPMAYFMAVAKQAAQLLGQNDGLEVYDI